jgi:DNA-binding NtrC family response regulator
MVRHDGSAVTRVLVVDDNPSVLRMVAAMLERQHHTVVLAVDGKTALAALASEPCDLMITDIDMPSMNGLELLRALRTVVPRPKVIAMSGQGMMPTQHLDMAELFGAVERLQKPFTNQELLAVVDRALAVA